jgi:hypothetical protein
MDFDIVNRLLEERGAKQETFQMGPRVDGKVERYYRLNDQSCLKIIGSRWDRKTGSTVESVCLSTYERKKQWESKTDPDGERYFDSFKEVAAYDLDKVPIGIGCPLRGNPPTPPDLRIAYPAVRLFQGSSYPRSAKPSFCVK